MSNTDAHRVQSVDRACSLLLALGSAPDGASLARLSRETGLHKSTACRLLATLATSGLVRQVPPDDRYLLGTALPALGDAARAQLLDGHLVHGVLRWLRDQTGETVHLAIPDRFELVYLDKVESGQSLQVASRVGARAPLYCTGLGKAYLANVSPQLLSDFLATVSLEPRTPNTIVDPEAFLSEMETIRRRGWSVDDVENELGVRCVGAAVLGDEQTAVAGVSVTAPATRMTKDKLPTVAALVVEAAVRIGKLIAREPVAAA
jgi:IclR family transcriptional regulator, KDG regulon repressor